MSDASVANLRLAPGVYTDVPEAAYHLDPAAEPSLSNSLGKILIESAPRKAWAAHPRLNPQWEPSDNSKFDVGSVAHRLLLGKGADYTIGDESWTGWTTKASKEFREAQNRAGKQPILQQQFLQATMLAAASRPQLESHPLTERIFRVGMPETVIIWRDQEIWCRCMIDWMEPPDEDGTVYVTEYKTTGIELGSDGAGGANHIYNMDYPVQFGFYERGILSAVEGAKRVKFRFCMQETAPPHLLRVYELDRAGEVLGRKRAAMAVQIWRECIEADHWPGYPGGITTAEMPSWIEVKWTNFELTDRVSDLLSRDTFLRSGRYEPQPEPAPLMPPV